jgi:tripartite ATP-independent transporter DctM subunit
MSVAIITILTIALLFLLFTTGMSIGIAMALAGFIGFSLLVGVNAALGLIAVDIYSTFSSYGLTVIILFTLMGQIAVRAGIAKDIYDCTHKWVGHMPGGLALGTIVAGGLFKAVCGSGTAASAMFAGISLPQMDRYGYDKRLSTGVVALLGTLGGLIPPSQTLILYGLISGVSIGQLFLAGIIPGIILALSFVATLFIWCTVNPSLGPKGDRATWKARFAALPSVGWVIAIFLAVLGGLMAGLFTPTEAGSVGAAAVLVVSLIKREINLKGLLRALSESVHMSCMMLFLLAGATILGHFFAVTRTPNMVSEFLGTLSLNPYINIGIICAIYIIGGEFIDDLAFFMLATPIFMPVVQNLGFDLVWFGVVIASTLMIGVVLPPLAMLVFLVSGMAKVPLGTVYKGIYPFLVGMVICVILFMFVPQLSLWLPNVMMK